MLTKSTIVHVCVSKSFLLMRIQKTYVVFQFSEGKKKKKEVRGRKTHPFDNQLAKLVNLSSLFFSNFSNAVNNFSKFLDAFVVGICLPFVVGKLFFESFHLFLCAFNPLLHHSVCTEIKRIDELTKRKGTQIKE